ncbi:hypothetical protein ACFL35_04650 [Candidatus Riflebacteria bacterium]
MSIKVIGSDEIFFLGMRDIEGREIYFRPEDVEIFQGPYEFKVENLKIPAKQKIKFPGTVFEVTLENESTFFFPGNYFEEFLEKLEEALTDDDYEDDEEDENSSED